MNIILKLSDSKILAWIFLILMLVIAIGSILMRFKTTWFEISDVFFGYMCAFTHLSSLYVWPLKHSAGDKLERVAFVLGLISVICFVAIYINKIA